MPDTYSPLGFTQQLATSERWYVLGICGSGMRSLVDILIDSGAQIVGSDSQLDSAAAALAEQTRWSHPAVTIRPWNEVQRYLESGRMAPTERIVATAAIPPDQFRFRRERPHTDSSLRLPLPDHTSTDGTIPDVMRLSHLTASLFRKRRQLCVAGTHGKSTVTGLLWWIMRQVGASPGLFLGGELVGNALLDAAADDTETTDADVARPCCRSIGRSGRLGTGEIAVIESCEFRRSFLQLAPQTAVLTCMDRDHFDCFPGEPDETRAFAEFLNNVPQNGVIVLNADCERSMSLAARRQSADGGPAHVTFGIDHRADWSATNIQCGSGGIEFLCHHVSAGSVAVSSALHGRHNVSNILAAMATAFSEGVPVSAIVKAVAEFPGIRRRLEYRGQWNGVTLLDDYAHHPTAIRATLESVRSAWPGKKVLAVFEPHQVSRTERLFEDFRNVLASADETLVLPVLPARETAGVALCCQVSGRLVRAINDSGGRSFLMANLDQAVARIDHVARNGDVVLTMGAGRTNLIHDEFHRRLSRDSAA